MVLDGVAMTVAGRCSCLSMVCHAAVWISPLVLDGVADGFVLCADIKEGIKYVSFGFFADDRSTTQDNGYEDVVHQSNQFFAMDWCNI
jgi:hypothetical protein